MNKSVTRIITALLSASILLSTFGSASVFAADSFKKFTEIAKMEDIKDPEYDPNKTYKNKSFKTQDEENEYKKAHTMTAAEGFTIYGDYAYSAKVSKDDKYVTFYKTDLKTKERTQLKFTNSNVSNSWFYKDKIGHANDMVAAVINGRINLFVACGAKKDKDGKKKNNATNSFVQLQVKPKENLIAFINGFDYKKSIDISGIDIVNDREKTISGGKKGSIKFLLKGPNGYSFYYKTFSYNEIGYLQSGAFEESLGNQISGYIEHKITKKNKNYQTQGIYCKNSRVYMPLAKKDGDKFLNKSVIISFPVNMLGYINHFDKETESKREKIEKQINLVYDLADNTKTNNRYQFEVEGCAYGNDKDGKTHMYFCANRGDNRDMIGYIN